MRLHSKTKASSSESVMIYSNLAILDTIFSILAVLVPAALEILAHTVLQAYGFSYIYDLIVLIMHEINSRRCWEFF